MTEGTVFEVEAGKRLAVGAPSLLAMPNGRLLVAFDLTGPDAKGLAGARGHDRAGNRWTQTRVFSSADGTASWQGVATLPMRCGRLFRDGGDVWLLGELNGALHVSRSPDGGGSWTLPAAITPEIGLTSRMSRPYLAKDGHWAVAVWRQPPAGAGWELWRAPAGGTLSGRKAWQCAAAMGDAVKELLAAGVPSAGLPAGGSTPGWGAGTALMELPDTHPWGGGLAALCSARCGRTDWGIVLRADGSAWVPPGGAPRPWMWSPVPGGQAAFSVAASGGRWWLVGQWAPPGSRWGRAVGEDPAYSAMGLWETADALSWEFRGKLLEGGLFRDPSAAAASNGQLWFACRAANGASRGVRDPRAVLCRKGPLLR